MTDAKGKRAKLDEDEGAELDPELVMAIEKLQEVQDDLERVNEEASDKVLEVEQRYNEIRRPVYNRRNEIIQNIPDFWLTAFLSHPVLCDLLSDEDQKVFKYLESLDVEDFKDVKSGYSITFTFKLNPYFEDTKLTKVFKFSDDGTTSVTGSTPKWKEGMDLTNGVVAEKENHKRAHSEDSFFKWFTDSAQKESVEGIQDEVAEVIKDDLWPNPLKYFNNEADDEEYEDEEEAEDDDDDTGKGADELDDEEEEPDEDEDDDES